jgi:hypothetical protein
MKLHILLSLKQEQRLKRALCAPTDTLLPILIALQENYEFAGEGAGKCRM